ncbi:MAG TPA: VanZ family protein [Candidatus Polarisedimenticolia bacterium]|nr:VanZ family protein [Candidatus Polarisedimenticolia bacterium]
MTARTTLRRIVVWGPLVGYLALIYYLSSRPSVGWAAPLWDKLLHFLEYGALALLTARAFNGSIRSPIPVRRLLFAGLAVVTYAISDEIHQAFVPPRQSDPLDVVADALGAATMLVLIWATDRMIFGRPSPDGERDARATRPLHERARKEPT